MTTLEDIQWNELTVAVRHEGQLTVWKAWKRSLAAFHDPRMWEGPGMLEQYFQRLDDDTRWGPAGYGFVAVDYDTREILSVNDFSHPSSFFLLADNVVWGQQEDPALAPLRALAARPDQWPYVKLSGFPLSGSSHGRDPVELSLDQIVPTGANETTFLAAITQKREGFDLGTIGTFMTMHGEYLPPGWTQHDDRGKELPEWLLDRLEALKASGFPAPDWALFNENIEEMFEGQLDALDQTTDENEDDDVRNMRLQAQRYLHLRKTWGTTTVKPRGP